MIKEYCDRCKKELSLQERLSMVEIKYFCRIGGIIQPINLCNDCLIEFKNYIEQFFKECDE